MSAESPVPEVLGRYQVAEELVAPRRRVYCLTKLTQRLRIGVADRPGHTGRRPEMFAVYQIAEPADGLSENHPGRGDIQETEDRETPRESNTFR